MTVNKQLNYGQAIALIEKFMNDSGIRSYCENICIGNCCNKCYTSDKACLSNEGRRLACSVYICVSLANLIFTSEEHIKYDYMSMKIRQQLNIARRAHDHTINYTNPYYEPYTTEQIRKFSIKYSDIVDNIPSCKSDIQRIYKSISSIINLSINAVQGYQTSLKGINK